MFGQFKFGGAGSGSGGNYYTLVMAIEQSGTTAPVISYIMYNDLVDISDISFSYIGIGNYSVNSASGIFTITKTFLNINQSYQGSPNPVTYIYANDDFSFNIETAINGVRTNGILSSMIEIRVYY